MLSVPIAGVEHARLPWRNPVGPGPHVLQARRDFPGAGCGRICLAATVKCMKGV
jgi:hypothetical protein